MSAIVFLSPAFGFFAGRGAADAAGYGCGGCVVDGGVLLLGDALVAREKCELLLWWETMGWRDTYTGAPWGAEALAAASAFSAGSFVAGLPGVEYAWFNVGWDGPVGFSPSAMFGVVVDDRLEVQAR